MEDGGENEETDLTGKCLMAKDELCMDFMDSTLLKHQELCQDDVNSFGSNKIHQKDDMDCFQMVDNSRENSVCLEHHSEITTYYSDLTTHSEDEMPLSSVSQVLLSAIQDTSKAEIFSDLKSFLGKEHVLPTIRSDVSKIDDSSTISSSPPASEVSFGAVPTHEQSKSNPTSHILQESDINSDTDEHWEPKKKIPRLNEKCKPNKHRDAKYAEMRRKNNSASQRSRQTKKQREREMVEKAVTLEKENDSLRTKEKKLKELVDKLKQMLFSSVNTMKK